MDALRFEKLRVMLCSGECVRLQAVVRLVCLLHVVNEHCFAYQFNALPLEV